MFGIERSFDIGFECSDNSHARKQHGSSIFSGINQHLDGKPPFLTFTFRLRKIPDVVGGVSQGLRRRPLREWYRLSERTIPGHAKLPSDFQTAPMPNRDAPGRQARRCAAFGSGRKGTPKAAGIRLETSTLVPFPNVVCPPRLQLGLFSGFPMLRRGARALANSRCRPARGSIEGEGQLRNATPT